MGGELYDPAQRDSHYQGNVAQYQLPAFLKTAEKLKIKGLAVGSRGSNDA